MENLFAQLLLQALHVEYVISLDEMELSVRQMFCLRNAELSNYPNLQLDSESTEATW